MKWRRVMVATAACAVDLVAAHVSPDGDDFDALAAFREPLGWHPEWQPNSAAWTRYMDKRMAQISRIEDTQQKWDGYLVAMQQGIHVQNYTERGWAVVDCPTEVYQPLLEAFHRGFDDESKRHFEGKVDQIHCEKEGGDTNSPCDGDRRSWMVHTGLNTHILRTLQPQHEEWAGVALEPSIAYGLRVYQNGSSLTMHTDRIETHVVSSILHVDRDYGGNEPWPIVIEGLDGVTAEVDLQPGQMLLYESAKCTHGRPRTFKGNWYTSLFIHYRPLEYALLPAGERSTRVPDTWRQTLPPLPALPPLTVYGTGFKEHSCKSGWCNLQEQWPPAGWQAGGVKGVAEGEQGGGQTHGEL